MGRSATRIRRCVPGDVPEICSIVNDAAQAYKGIIPADCWHEPYMALDELKRQIAEGVAFWCSGEQGAIDGVMGIQDRGEVSLIRHAYVRTALRRTGIGETLLRYLEGTTDTPVLIGTWRAASWAIRFYEKNGYRLLEPAETARLLRRYWNISDRQIETSVVLADSRWR